MSLGPDDYREGALLRLQDAQTLFYAGQWIGAVYLAGRAAQAMLRALLAIQDRQLEVGHDLREHLRKARRAGILCDPEDEPIQDAVNELAVLWRNDLRFIGKRRSRALLKDVGRLHRVHNRPVKGSAERINARLVLNAAESVVARGEVVWNRLKKN